MKLTLGEGKQLITLARAAIEEEEFETEGFEQECGVFVTILSYPDKQLRGCIGFPQPVIQLNKAVVEAAKGAAYYDSRFKPISKDEQFLIEISVLTPPEMIKARTPEEVLGSFTVGTHGLIIECADHYGLLLPEVFVEWKADTQKALEMTCEKAGADINAWKDKDCKIYKFEAQVFIEKSPNGEIVEKKE